MIGYSLRENQRRLQFTLSEPITKAQWATFVAFQFADIYTTYKGLQYECVKEINPLVGENPSINRMFYTKIVILQPAIKYDMEKGNLDPKIMNEMNFLMSLVVLNNYQVWKKATTNCKKIT